LYNGQFPIFERAGINARATSQSVAAGLRLRIRQIRIEGRQGPARWTSFAAAWVRAAARIRYVPHGHSAAPMYGCRRRFATDLSGSRTGNVSNSFEVCNEKCRSKQLCWLGDCRWLARIAIRLVWVRTVGGSSSSQNGGPTSPNAIARSWQVIQSEFAGECVWDRDRRRLECGSRQLRGVTAKACCRSQGVAIYGLLPDQSKLEIHRRRRFGIGQ